MHWKNNALLMFPHVLSKMWRAKFKVNSLIAIIIIIWIFFYKFCSQMLQINLKRNNRSLEYKWRSPSCGQGVFWEPKRIIFWNRFNAIRNQLKEIYQAR